MSDPPKSVPTLSFGTPATSGGPGFSAPSQTSASENKTPSNIFGSATNPSTSSSTLFGSAGNTSGGTQQPSLFGAGAQSGQGSSLFGGGGGTSKPASTGFSFGPQPTASNNQSSSFSFGKPPETGGAKATNTSTPFSGFSTPDKTSAPGQAQSTGLFGGVTSSGGNGLFGNAASSTPATSKASGGFSFANPSTTPAGPPPVGGHDGASTGGFSFNKPQQQAANLFGNSKIGSSAGQETSTTAAPSNLFGNLSQPSSGGLFGSSKPADTIATTTTTAPPSNMFANANTSSGTGLFNMMAATKPASGLFSNLSNTQESTAHLPLTTGAQQQSQQTQQSGAAQPSSLFAVSSNQSAGISAPTQETTPSLFSGPASGTASSTNPKPALSFPSSTAAPTTQPLSAPATMQGGSGTHSLFSNLGTSAAGPSSATQASASTAGGLFANLGKPADKTTSSSDRTPSTTVTGRPTGSSAPAPSSSLFGDLNKPAGSTSTTQAPVASGVTSGKNNDNSTSTTTANLGTSTSGPAPPPQSRLKNKSMDEIITRWASDLSKYQKEFQSQAEKVAKWDRMLVENSDKIQKLYGSTLEAERATSEVERQLSAVEGQQDELSGWLDRYERDVEEMTLRQVSQGEGLQGPDQERERTYKLAEKLSERLEEMGKDLASMIEEINDASSTISKNNKVDDPISQIVRVLNGHLSQLQMIDQGAAALQAKVAAAQKAGQGLSSTNGFKGLGSDAADDFYRSYMGRR